MANKQQTLSVGENMHYQRTTILIFFLMLMPASSTIAFSDPVKKSGTAGTILLSKKYAEFNEPWGMAFLPRGDILVTEKRATCCWSVLMVYPRYLLMVYRRLHTVARGIR